MDRESVSVVGQFTDYRKAVLRNYALKVKPPQKQLRAKPRKKGQRL
jgi:hypothetical protein